MRISPQRADATIDELAFRWSPSVENGRFANGVGVSQLLPWGGAYRANWNNNRDTTTSLFFNFSPQLNRLST